MSNGGAIVGIDYGSKLAGTTVLTVTIDKKYVSFYASEKKKDAEVFILKTLESLQIKAVFIDVPLSFPGVYCNELQYDEYLYRKTEKELKAMSPIFWGLNSKGYEA